MLSQLIDAQFGHTPSSWGDSAAGAAQLPAWTEGKHTTTRKSMSPTRLVGSENNVEICILSTARV